MRFGNVAFLSFASVRRDGRRGRAPPRRDSLRSAERIGTSGLAGVRVAARPGFRQDGGAARPDRREPEKNVPRMADRLELVALALPAGSAPESLPPSVAAFMAACRG